MLRTCLEFTCAILDNEMPQDILRKLYLVKKQTVAFLFEIKHVSFSESEPSL